MQLGTLIDAEEETPPIYTMINPTRKRLQAGMKKHRSKMEFEEEWIQITSSFWVMRSSLWSYYTCLIFDEAILLWLGKYICTKERDLMDHLAKSHHKDKRKRPHRSFCFVQKLFTWPIYSWLVMMTNLWFAVAMWISFKKKKKFIP